MKSVFLGKKDVIDRVFTKEVKECLKTEANLDPEFVISESELEESAEFLKDVDYVFSTWGMPTPNEEQVKRLFPALKEIFFAAGSVQTFARPFFANNVKIHSSWAANGVPVAEYTVAQIILANKGYFMTSRYQSNGDLVKAKDKIMSVMGNYNCKVGLIGVGMIGTTVAKMLKNYNLQVLVYDPFLSDENAEKLGVEKVSLETLFSECQTISNHLADNEQTKCMLNKNLFDRMNETVTFINTGRGAQVVESDLACFMKEHPFATAVLDVTFPEPPEKNSPFYALENVVLTPHIAGSLGNEVQRMGVYMLNEFRKASKGEKCDYEVTEKMLSTMA